eukprot:TRINITY_DN7758_c2_g3_i1.p3 TRINITY_DN7758_c2_g3~~TRINITY_DN7758_c2_g3_i1.p3  ORF type:complete len:221 (+),score=69.12 TRINITY_DN7758_c2_g3_i1:79-741(+)
MGMGMGLIPNQTKQILPMSEKMEKDQSSLTVLVIDKGFGGGEKGSKGRYLAERFENVEFVQVPEPREKKDVVEGGRRVMEWMDGLDGGDDVVLVGCSRGGKVVAEVVEEWKGGIVLISALSTLDCTSHHRPMVLFHGINDGINIIERVRQEVDDAGSCVELIELDDDHHVASIVEGDGLEKAIWRSVELMQGWKKEEKREKELSDSGRRKLLMEMITESR